MGTSYPDFQDALIGVKMKTYENAFHHGHLYIEIEDGDLWDGVVQNIEALFQETKRPLQTGVFSDDVERIRLLVKCGFLRKRRCYEIEVRQSDLLVQLSENACKLLEANEGSASYAACAQMMFRAYARTHAEVNPLTATFEEFIQILPANAVFMERDGEIRALAFVEKNEIAYLASDSPEDLPSFFASLLTRMFSQYEYIFFEADDVDPTAMALKHLFAVRPSVSFDTYVKTGAKT